MTSHEWRTFRIIQNGVVIAGGSGPYEAIKVSEGFPVSQDNPRRVTMGHARDEKLIKLIEAARTCMMDETAKEEQRISFAYGNAADGDIKSTKESVRAASKIQAQPKRKPEQ